MADDARQSQSVDTLIIGAGLAGLSAAYHMKGNYLVAEAGDHPGGAAATLRYGGFQLDRGVHILYGRDPWTPAFIRSELGVALDRKERQCGVWFDERIAPFPLQFNLASLSASKRLSLGLSGLKASLFSRAGIDFDPLTMDQWARCNFGSELAEQFFNPYNEKLWGVATSHLTTEWMDGYVPRPSAASLLRGVVGRTTTKFGANAAFWYPQSGSIASIAEALASRVANLCLQMRLKSLDLKKQEALFHNGATVQYRRLVSTIPLSDLMNCLTSKSDELQSAVSLLKHNALALMHILVKREAIGCGNHWIYVPQSDIPFYRITFPHNICSACCPKGWSALTLEIGGIVVEKARTERRSKDALVAMGMLHSRELDSEVVWDELSHGYVRYDRERAQVTHQILDYMNENNVVCIGRYGRWEYSNMESALIQGREINKRLERCSTRRHIPKQATQPQIASPLHKYFAVDYPARGSRLREILFRRGEADRMSIVKRWIPHTEALIILDAGCGDGRFVAEILHGTPIRMRLEDMVAANSELAERRLSYKADAVEAAAITIADSTDTSKYDLILALGITDYADDWSRVLAKLAFRCAGDLVIDFSKSGTIHYTLRKAWLRLHNIKLRACTRSELEQLLFENRLKGEVVETRIQFVVRINRRMAVKIKQAVV